MADRSLSLSVPTNLLERVRQYDYKVAVLSPGFSSVQHRILLELLNLFLSKISSPADTVKRCFPYLTHLVLNLRCAVFL